MPPKKKGRAPKAASTLSGEASEHTVEDPPTSDAPQDVTTSDPWTDEQETSLFKAIIRWKPVGMHKHFRMIAIAEHLKNHGYNGYVKPQNAHTKIPGIWEKLSSLYNLEVLDNREDNIGSPLEGESEEAKESIYEFALPYDDYRDQAFARRLEPDGSSSPPSLPHQLSNLSVEGGRAARRCSTVDDTDEPRSSPASAWGTPSGRSKRTSKGTRSSRLAEVSVPGGGQAGKDSVERGTEDEEKGEGNEDTMHVDEEHSRPTTVKDKGKASKGFPTKKSTRRSGRVK